MKNIPRVLLLLICFAVPGSLTGQDDGPEIYLLSIDHSVGNKNLVIKSVGNISKNPGYDNQPSFSAGNESVLYVSSRGGEATDIFEYFLASGKTVQITSTAAGEYSPRSFDENTITFVREGSGQEMTVIKYDRVTKKETPALNIKEPIGYYAWNYRGDALVWVRYAFMIHWVNVGKKINYFVADHAQPSIPQHIPGTGRFSFIERHPNDEMWIKEFDPETRATRPIIETKDENLNYCWLPDGSILIGGGSKLFRFKEDMDGGWKEADDLSPFGIKNISRMAASSDGKYLAVVGTG